ncbi:MAG: hypothetical protein P8049_08690 [Gemmatimonadota bacterium]
MQTLLAWLIFLIALTWSLLLGALAGVGTVTVSRRSSDLLNGILAALFMFGGALMLTARLVPGRYLMMGAIGFVAGIPLAMALRAGGPLPFFHDEKEPMEPEAERESGWTAPEGDS